MLTFAKDNGDTNLTKVSEKIFSINALVGNGLKGKHSQGSLE